VLLLLHGIGTGLHVERRLVDLARLEVARPTAIRVGRAAACTFEEVGVLKVPAEYAAAKAQVLAG